VQGRENLSVFACLYGKAKKNHTLSKSMKY